MSTISVLDRHRPRGDSQFAAVAGDLDARGLLITLRKCMTWAGLLLPGLAVCVLLANGSAQSRILTIIAVAVVVSASSFWWTRKWPTRTISAAFVATATVATVAFSLAAGSPLLVALGFAASSPLAIYIELFHPRLTWFYVSALAATAVWLDFSIDHGDAFATHSVALAGGGVIIAAALAVGHLASTILDVQGIDSEIDPTTGLYRRHAFDAAVGMMIGSRNRSGDRYLALVAIAPDVTRHPIARLRRNMARAITESTRRDAIVGQAGPGIFLVADIVDCSDAAPIADRLRGVSATVTRLSVSAGAVTLPLAGLDELPPDELVDGLVDRTIVALDAARLAGGNQIRHAPSADGGTLG